MAQAKSITIFYQKFCTSQKWNPHQNLNIIKENFLE
jgi:hypothetical protein